MTRSIGRAPPSSTRWPASDQRSQEGRHSATHDVAFSDLHEGFSRFCRTASCRRTNYPSGEARTTGSIGRLVPSGGRSGSRPTSPVPRAGVSAALDKKGRTWMVNNRLRQKAGPCRDESPSIPCGIWDAISAKSCQMQENDQMSRTLQTRKAYATPESRMMNPRPSIAFAKFAPSAAQAGRHGLSCCRRMTVVERYGQGHDPGKTLDRAFRWPSSRQVRRRRRDLAPEGTSPGQVGHDRRRLRGSIICAG